MKLIIKSDSLGEVLLAAEAKEGSIAFTQVKEDLIPAVERWMTQGLSEWVGGSSSEFRDTYPRLTPLTHPRFLPRLQAYLDRQFNFESILTEDNTIMEMSEALDELNKKLFYYDWFAKKVDKNPILSNSIVAYVHRMTSEVYAAVPDKIGNWDVRIHFIASTASADSFKVPPPKMTIAGLAAAIDKDGPLTTTVLASTSVPEEVDTDVAEEVWQLSKQCGWETLEDIFYEVHDGKNAITNKGKEFPKVYETLKELYDLVGFDVLADEIS